jgi:hypothetical protein
MSRFMKVMVALGSVLRYPDGFLLFPGPADPESILMKKLSESLHREVTVERIHFNPFTLA